MPEIYEYLGILIHFYSNEHDPIHVHAKYDGKEIKAEFFIEDGQLKEIKLKSVRNLPPLTGAQLQDFTYFVEVYANEIIEKWVNYFILHKKIKAEKITRRLR